MTFNTIEEIMLPRRTIFTDTATAKDAIIMMDEAPFGIIPVVDEASKSSRCCNTRFIAIRIVQPVDRNGGKCK